MLFIHWWFSLCYISGPCIGFAAFLYYYFFLLFHRTEKFAMGFDWVEYGWCAGTRMNANCFVCLSPVPCLYENMMILWDLMLVYKFTNNVIKCVWKHWVQPEWLQVKIHTHFQADYCWSSCDCHAGNGFLYQWRNRFHIEWPVIEDTVLHVCHYVSINAVCECSSNFDVTSNVI